MSFPQLEHHSKAIECHNFAHNGHCIVLSNNEALLSRKENRSDFPGLSLKLHVYSHNDFIASAALILFHASLFIRKRNGLQSKLFIYQFFMQSFYSFVEDQFELLVEATVLDDNNNVRIMIMIM